jgi:hypothetical protein
VVRWVRGKDGKMKRVQIGTAERRRSMNPWFLKHNMLTWGYFLESLSEIVNLARADLGLKPVGSLLGEWGHESKLLWEMYLTLKDQWLYGMPVVVPEGVLILHPMIVSMFQMRIYDVTPEFRAESHVALQRLSKDAGIPFPPSDIYGTLGKAGELLQQLHSLVRRGRFDPNTAAGLAARQNISDKMVEHFDPNTESGLAARQNISDKMVEHFDPNAESGLAARQNISDKLVEHFDPNTESGLAARQNISDKMVEHFDPNTESGLAARQNISDKLVEHFDPNTESGLAARQNISDQVVKHFDPNTAAGQTRTSGLTHGRIDAKQAQIRELKEVLVRRIQTHHKQAHFDVESWIADLRRSQDKSHAAHALEKANKGILPEKPHDVYRANMNAIIKAGEPTNERSDAFHVRKLKETLQHLIDTPYDFQDVRASARDANELQRIHTHLWWTAQGAVKHLNRKPRQRRPRK